MTGYHHFYQFKENLLEKVLLDFPAEGTVFIFPTARSKKEALRIFQESWTFSRTLFQTLEELKESLFLVDSLLLREEKRNLALYHALSPGQKHSLKIENYFQFIGFAADFFSFWEEFGEEEIDAENCLDILCRIGDEVLDWQQDLYTLLLDIRNSYRNYLEDHNLSDKIFLYAPDNLSLDYYENYKGFVFVNQHYYTKLENRLIRLLDEKGIDIAVCYQLPETYIDKETNSFINKTSFPFEDLQDLRTEQIEIFIAQNDFSLYRQLCKTLSVNPELKSIVDGRFYRSSYPRLFSPASFSGVDKESLLNSRQVIFLTCLNGLLENILYEGSRSKELIPLEILKEQLTEPVFISYFVSVKYQQEILLQIIDRFIRQNIRYIDFELELLKQFESKRLAGGEEEIRFLDSTMRKIISLLNKAAEVESIGSLIMIIDRKEGLELERLLSEDERRYSDIPELFYTALADFATIEELGLIPNEGFWREGRPVNRFTNCSGILKLFLLYLRPKRNKWYYDYTGSRKEITTLLDSRNLSFEQVAILNVTEGILPSARSTPFLFTEAQRKKLGLKTYEDIRYWEKYYFFRLLLSSSKVYLFAQSNQAKNIEISSLIEELKLVFSRNELHIYPEKESLLSDEGYNSFYRSVIKPDEKYLPDRTKLTDLSFYSLPFAGREDIKDKTLNLSHTAFSVMYDSPFSYYLKYLAGIEEEYVYRPFSPLLIGTIAHYIMERVWNIIPEPVEEDLTEFFYSLPLMVSGILKQDRNNLLNTEYFYYRIPHSYSYRYFKEVFLPVVEDGIVDFFNGLGKIIDYRDSDIRFHRELISPKGLPPVISNEDWLVYLKGRVDLLIEETDKKTGKAVRKIIDYKTGKTHLKKPLIRQLIIYELIFHYLSEQKGAGNHEPVSFIYESENISSYIYSLSEKKMQELSELSGKTPKGEKIREFLDDTAKLLNLIKLKGWFGQADKTGYILFPEIIRTDLLKKYFPPGAWQNMAGGE